MLPKDKYLFLNSINHQWTNSLSCQCYTVTPLILTSPELPFIICFSSSNCFVSLPIDNDNVIKRICLILLKCIKLGQSTKSILGFLPLRVKKSYNSVNLFYLKLLER